MDDILSLGLWIKRRRKALDLTQDALARQVGCALGTLKKIETDERRPSKQLAERFADCLQIAYTERAAFLKAARTELSVDRLPPPTQHVPRAIFVPAIHAHDHAEVIAPAPLPGGTVTFLFTDIEGSTELWERDRAAAERAIARHDAIVRQTMDAYGGHIFNTAGDAFHVAFTTASDALDAILAAQRTLAAEAWGLPAPIRVRAALHVGAAQQRDGDYYGPPLNRTARLCATGHGGQVLLSHATQALVCDHLPQGVSLRELGTHRLKDLTRPEQIFQLVAPDLPSDFPPLRTLDARPNNLPAQPTALIGREREAAAVAALLRGPDARLLTLTGTGGTGKTRLSLQVAADLLDDFEHGVFFVALAPVRDPALVAATMAQTLGVKESGGRVLLDSLKDYLRAKHALLLLDNFEQVLDAAPLVAELLAAAPRLAILATSREVLHLRGEKEFPVPPLALPPVFKATEVTERTEVVRAADKGKLKPSVSSVRSVADLSQYAAVQLFIARVLDAQPDFTVTNENAPAVTEICYRLDGLPLAIELVAARIKLFSPQALLGRLSNRLALLTGGPRDLPARQQTLRNTIDWSYELLSADEQTLFRRLGVFVGGCTIEAGEAVCAGDGLAALVDQSLLQRADGVDGEPRFVMLETIREYALERLRVSREADTIEYQFAAYHLALAETAAPELRGARQLAWLDRLETEHDNLSAALAYCLEARDLPLEASDAEYDKPSRKPPASSLSEIGLRLAAALWWFWLFRAYFSEGRGWLKTVLEQSGAGSRAEMRTPARAQVLAGAGILAYYQSDYDAIYALGEESLAIAQVSASDRDRALALTCLAVAAEAHKDFTTWNRGDDAAARSFGEGSLALFRAAGDVWDQAVALQSLGHIAHRQGDNQRATTCAVESLELCRTAGDRFGQAGTMAQLGHLLRLQGDYGQAETYLTEALAILRELGGNESVAWTLYHLSIVAQRQGDDERAKRLLGESLGLFQELKNEELGIACFLEGMAEVAGSERQPARVVRLFGAATPLRGDIPPFPDERIAYDRLLAAAREQLGDAAFAAAWEEGQAMTQEQAIAYALGADV